MLLYNGSPNEIQLRTFHDLQTLFFFNLRTCVGNHGSQVTGTFGVNHPFVAECLDSANKNMLLPSPQE